MESSFVNVKSTSATGQHTYRFELRRRFYLHFKVTDKDIFRTSLVVNKDIRYFPKGLSQSGNFPRVYSQVPTSQMCNFPSGIFLSLSQTQRWPNLTFWKLPLGKLLIWEVATLEIITWNSWENAFGKVSDTELNNGLQTMIAQTSLKICPNTSQ